MAPVHRPISMRLTPLPGAFHRSQYLCAISIEMFASSCWDNLGSQNSSSTCIHASDEVSSSTQKVPLTITTLRYLWFQRDMQPLIKCQIYTAALWSIRLYNLEARSLTVDERLSVFEYHFLRVICLICLVHFLSNSEDGCEIVMGSVIRIGTQCEWVKVIRTF